jgi:hypothetical protein
MEFHIAIQYTSSVIFRIFKSFGITFKAKQSSCSRSTKRKNKRKRSVRSLVICDGSLKSNQAFAKS